MMEGVGVDADAPLDYATFQIFPTENRYEAFVHSGNRVEKLATGAVEQLLPHLPEVKNLYLKGSDANFMLQLPKNLHHAAWFTKSTLNRFLSIVSLPDLINNINGIKNEMCQLEETRKFHLSLYARGCQDGSRSREPDGSGLTNMASSNASKNELLRAMDLRLTSLRKEFAAAFNQAISPTCSEQLTDLTEFSQHFGAAELENCLRKFQELNQNRNIPVSQNDNKNTTKSDSKNVKLNKPDVKTQTSKPVHTVSAVIPVKYGVSPAKLAEIERECSTESDGSSDQSDEEQKSVERSRTLIRSASPRRSASPMRRVQIGRSGSRRATAITIKSLNIFPARERTSHGDSSEEEGGTEQPSKKPEGHVRRMSVQDAISLFERKQNDQTTDTQKGSSTNSSISAKKSVLRRWSTGLGELSIRAEHEIVSEDSVPMNSNNEASPKSSVEVNSDSGFTSTVHDHADAAEDVKSEISVNKVSESIDDQAETNMSQQEEINEKLTASSEWSRQKEAELNQMLMKMMESKPTKYKKLQNSKTQNPPSEQRGGFYDHYKEKRDEKLRGENAGKRAEKEARVNAMLQILDKRKTQIASANASGGKKNHIRKPQKSPSNASQSPNPKQETEKPTVTKKVPSRAQSMPATRKSWPSTPSPKLTGTPAPKTPSASPTPSRRKPSPTPSVRQPSPKVEKQKPLQQQRNVKKPETSNDKGLKTVNEKKQQPVAKTGKPVKSKVATAPGDSSGVSPSKPSLYNKVTKKNSVVPLESKPFLRKGSKTPPGVGSVVDKAKKNPRLSDEYLRKSGNFVEAPENVIAIDSIPVSLNNETSAEAPNFCDTVLEAKTDVKDMDAEVIDDVVAGNIDVFKDVTESPLKGQEDDDDDEESMISPTAWVEIEEQYELPKTHDVGSSEFTSTATNGAAIGSSSPRVRHSLSQMLQEESSEHDFEWGNAENPPTMIYQKDVPKGFKRLLKFARKSKGDANSSGWSSPSVFSEGEDDTEEAKAVSKRNGQNLLRKAALHAAMNQGPPKASLHEGFERNSDSCEFLSAESDTSKFNARSSHKFHDGISGSVSSTKATRSFFSLSAFRGSTKPNETKLR